MTTTTVQATGLTKKDPITIESWNNVLFMMQEPDRHGNTVWNIRLALGDLPPWRYGPFESKKDAHAAFSALIAFVDRELLHLCCEAGNQAGCDGNEEY